MEVNKTTKHSSDKWVLRLYVSGKSAKTMAAVDNFRRICSHYLPGTHDLQVIDIHENQSMAEADKVLAVPMLIRKQPAPVRRLIGDLSNTELVLTVLELN